ncbi:Zinc finger domain containing protein [Planococcus donghaensis MPA1U2]|uniref:Zinc finger domain containing protein n=1 Tax=Planococcus donghaensis MPA1U2 TaxID=933115 RepID=E7RJN8_9BACL|nr:CHY zinc finger protein [Planococcus donghaensis]EGA88880.1 Zinc finger domain containing protein [Planococcus donghaensis MPA1U2]
MPHHQQVKGINVDAETRCIHYHSPIDRIAIKFFCCQEYFPCFECHEARGCGEPRVWPTDRFDEKAILCGTCGHELTVTEYLTCSSTCPSCSSSFNPGCSLHKHLYFE